MYFFIQSQQVRNFIGYRQLRDRKRRRLAKQYAEERLRLVALKRNNILPPEIIVNNIFILQLWPKRDLVTKILKTFIYPTIHTLRLNT